jgi:hypothetical protein
MDGERLSFSSLEQSSATPTPEVALAVAVLHRAVLDCITQGVPAPMRRSAYYYLTGTDRAWPFSFLNVAEFFSDDAEDFRKRVLGFVKEMTGQEDLKSVFCDGPPPRRYQPSDRYIPEEDIRHGRLSASERLRYCRGTRGRRPRAI